MFQKVWSLKEIPFHLYGFSDCVAFDLDDTVFLPESKLMRSANGQARAEFIEFVRLEKGDVAVSKIYESLQYILVDDCLLETLQTLSDKQVSCIGFTARRTGKASPDVKVANEDNTLTILKKLGVQFKSIHLSDVVLKGMNPQNPQYEKFVNIKKLLPFSLQGDVMLKEHVLFSNNLDKGLVLGALFEEAQFFPQTFVLVDDLEQNLVSVKEAINYINQTFKKNIQFYGYHFLGAEKFDHSLSPDVLDTCIQTHLSVCE